MNRGLFIIDDKGILRQITMNDLPVGRSVDEVLRLVQAFQFTDKHGEGKEDIHHCHHHHHHHHHHRFISSKNLHFTVGLPRG